MTGICGFLRLDGAAATLADVEAMARAIVARGPDRQTVWTGGPAAMGCVFMRTTHEDAFDTQPLREGDLTLVADARLDNREALADALAIAPAELAAMADSALILRAYQRWGEDCAERLVGDFAFAVWDAAARRLVLGRDHMGQRYVFYHRSERVFAFASDQNGLFALPTTPRILSEDQLGRLLIYDRRPKTGETLFEGVMGLTPASTLSIDLDGRTERVRRYWRIGPGPEHLGRDEAYYVRAYRAVLEEAVACRVRRLDAPAALFFSGGFDSSAIAGLAGPAVSAQQRKLVCLSSVMPEDYAGPLRDARPWVEVCRRHMPHIDVRYLTREGLSVLTDLDASMARGEVPSTPHRFTTEMIYRAAAEAGARVVMDGDGGDYTINPRGQAYLAFLARTFRWRRLAREVVAHRRVTRQSYVQIAKLVVMLVLPTWARRLRQRLRQERGPFYDDLTIAEPLARKLLAEGARPMHDEAIRLSAQLRPALLGTLNAKYGLASPAGGVLAGAMGLEFTQPYHDKRVVELALAVPEELYVKDGRHRHLARTALADVYPPEYQTRDRLNDERMPDILDMVARIRPQLMCELDRLAGDAGIGRMVDVAKTRRLLDESERLAPARRAEALASAALYGFLVARWIEWLRGRRSAARADA